MYPPFISLLWLSPCLSPLRCHLSPSVLTVRRVSRRLCRACPFFPPLMGSIPRCPSAHSNCKQRVPFHSSPELFPVPTLEFYGRSCPVCPLTFHVLQAALHLGGSYPGVLPAMQKILARTLQPRVHTALRPSRKVDPARQTKVWRSWVGATESQGGGPGERAGRRAVARADAWTDLRRTAAAVGPASRAPTLSPGHASGSREPRTWAAR